MKKCVLSLFVAVASAVVGFRVHANDTIVSETNLVQAVTSTVVDKKHLNVTVDKPARNSNHKADYLFNGISWSPNANSELESFDKRYLDNITQYGTADKTGVWAQVTAPDAFYQGKRVVLKKYRLHRLAYWGNSINRAPTEWKIYGVRKDKTKVLLAYENLGPNHWSQSKFTEKVPENEVNEFSVQNIDAAHEGFRSYRVEFINSHYTLNRNSIGTSDALRSFDLGLQELSLFVDIKETQTLLTSNIDTSETKLQFNEAESFAPHLATTFNGPQTLRAPKRVNKAFHSYKLKGYKIEKNVDDTWVTDSEVALSESENSFTFTPSTYANRLRITWLYDEMPWYEDMGPVSFAKYLFAHGISLWEFGASGNYTYQNSAGNLFDTLSFLYEFADGDPRFISSIYNAVANNTHSYVRARIPEKVLNAGHEFLITKYRPYSLSLAGNEIVRRPTAWTLQVTNTTSEGKYIDVDSQTNVSWSTSTHNREYQNYLEFNLKTPVPFCALQLILQDSAAYQAHKDDSLSTSSANLDVGMMEFEVFVGVANPRGTLRVMTVLENIDPEGFSHPRGTLVNESAILTAPQYGVMDGKRHICLGYRIETFDETTCTWVGGEVVDALSYSHTPDPAKRERLTWVYDLASSLAEVTFQSEGNELVTANVAGTDGSYYNIGDTLTITAIGNNDNLAQPNGETNQFHSTFVRWVGDLDGLDIDPTSPTITFTVDRPRKLVPLFTRDWLYYKTDGEWRIKNGNWDLGVYEITSGSSTLALGSFAYRSGAGVLDLSTPIYHYQTGKRLTMTCVDARAMVLRSNDYVPSAQVTELILPTELESIGQLAFRSTGDLRDNPERFTLTNLVVNCPNLTSIAFAAFTRQYNLHKVQLNIPKCKTFLSQYTFYAASFRDTDFETWDLSGLTSICPSAFQHDNGNGVGDAALHSSGVLRMPVLEGTIPTNAFWQARQASGYEFGAAKGRISNIHAQAFHKNAATNFVFGSLPTLTVAKDAFSNKDPIANLTFVNCPPDDPVQLDNILLCNNAEAMANVYVSKLRDNWRSYVTPVDQIADETVKAEALARGAYGAYKSQGDAGVWKAFVFAQSMPLDPKGTIVIVR